MKEYTHNKGIQPTPKSGAADAYRYVPKN